jgi:hypothetical protein
MHCCSLEWGRGWGVLVILKKLWAEQAENLLICRKKNCQEGLWAVELVEIPTNTFSSGVY